MRLPRNFNPLHREGGDSKDIKIKVTSAISIHSTARVETKQEGDIKAVQKISIHSTARVETYDRLCRYMEFCISIHSTARVETLRIFFTSTKPKNFNPLHREGGDD